MRSFTAVLHAFACRYLAFYLEVCLPYMLLGGVEGVERLQTSRPPGDMANPLPVDSLQQGGQPRCGA